MTNQTQTQHKTTYRLGETCKWSMGTDTVYRYVDVTVEGASEKGPRTQCLQLPEHDAFALCAAMGSRDHKLRVLEQALEQHSLENGSSWYKASALPAAASLLQECASLLTKWLGHIDMKYVNLRIDMRGGSFTITSSSGSESVANKVIEMCKELSEAEELKAQQELSKKVI